MTLRERYKAPTPSLFKRVSMWGKILLAVSAGVGSIAAVSVAPVAGVLAAAAAISGAIGTTAVAVAEATVDHTQDGGKSE